ncbi:centromere protein N [Arapaima gigas]
MEDLAKEVLTRIVRKIPVVKLRQVLGRWERLSERQLRSLDFTQPKWALCENLLSLCEENNITVKQLAEIEMLYRTEYPDQGIWHVFQFVDTPEETQCSDFMHFRDLFKANLKSLINHVSIQMKKLEDESVWIRIAWGENFRRPNHLKPTYVVHHLQTPYVFVSGLTNKHKPLLFQALALSAQCGSVKDVNLSGRCLSALRDLSMRQYKQVFPISHQECLQERDPLPNPNIENEHIKLTEYKQQVASEVFGDAVLPKLETAVYKLETKYREHGNENLVKKDEPFRGVVKFSSSNLLESLKYCVSSGMASAPVTPLLSSITQKGRNYFVIKDKGSGLIPNTPGPKF